MRLRGGERAVRDEYGGSRSITLTRSEIARLGLSCGLGSSFCKILWRLTEKLLTAEIAEGKHAKIAEKGKAMMFFAFSAAFLRDLCGERLFGDPDFRRRSAVKLL